MIPVQSPVHAGVFGDYIAQCGRGLRSMYIDDRPTTNDRPQGHSQYLTFWENFKWPQLSNASTDPLHVWFYPAPFKRYCRFLCSRPYCTLYFFLGGGSTRRTRSPVLRSVWVWAGTLSYLAVQLFSKYSNLCEKNIPDRNRQTDRRMDGRLTVAQTRSA